MPKHFFMLKRSMSSKINSAAQKPATGIKGLIAKYGYTSLATYLLIGAVDFAICFGVLHSIGEEALYLKYNDLKKSLGFEYKDQVQIHEEFEHKRKIANEKREKAHADADAINRETSFYETVKTYSNEVVNNYLFKEILIAYGIHKSLIFIRLPITAAITPPIYKYLLKVKPQWVLRPQKYTIKTFDQSIKDSVYKKNKKTSWWRKIIG
ncbi:hypothetical protein ACO0R3_002629 [Hanseniaspora guilliermondii]